LNEIDKQRFAFKLNYDIAPEMKRGESLKDHDPWILLN